MSSKQQTPTSGILQHYYSHLERLRYPLNLYFPTAMFLELSQSDWRNKELPVSPVVENGTTPKTNGTINIQDVKLHNGYVVPPANEARTEKRFDTIRTMGIINPAAPFANVTPVKLIVATNKSLHEANELAMKEVYEYHNESAHRRGDFSIPPNPDWIRKAGATEDWPMTWKVGNGQLRFSLITDRGEYKTTDKIYVVRSSNVPAEDTVDGTNVMQAGRLRMQAAGNNGGVGVPTRIIPQPRHIRL